MTAKCAGLKSLLILSYVLYVVGVMSAWASPVQGNEPSIYLSTPILFWIAVVVSFLVGIYSVLGGHFQKESRSCHPKAGWILLIFASMATPSVFIIRGYSVMNLGGDTGTHYGNLQNLLEVGITTSSYPYTYLETSILKLLTNIDLSHIVNLNTLLFVGIFLLGFYLLSGILCTSKYERIFVMIIGFFLPFGSTYYATGGLSFSMYFPYLSAFVLCPTFMYLTYSLINAKTTNHRKIMVCLLIIGFCILTCHIFIFFLSSLFLFAVLLSSWMCVGKFHNLKWTSACLFKLLCVFGIMFLCWSYYLNLIQTRVTTLSEFLINSVVSDVYGDTLTQTVIGNYFGSLDLWEIGDLIIRQGGLLLIMVSFLIILLPSVGMSLKIKKYNYLFSLYLFIFLTVGVVLLSLVLYLGIDPGRLIMFVSLCSIFPCGILLSSLFQKVTTQSFKNKRILFGTVLVITLILLLTFSIGSYYPSMHTAVTTPKQVTESSLNGIDFYFQNSNYDHQELGISGALWRYSQSLSSSTYMRQNGLDKRVGVISSPPDHFGYSENVQLAGENVTSPTYLLLMNSYLTNYNENPLWKYKVPPFTYGDVSRLNYDGTVSKIYDNPEFTISLISPYREQ